MSRRARRRGRAGNADAALERAVEAVNAGDAERGFELARGVLARTGRDDAAEVAGHAALRLAPEAAVQALQALVDLRPDSPGLLNDQAGMLCHLGRFDEAEAVYRRALEADPDAPATLANLGQALLSLERPEDAEAAFRAALAADPGHAAALNGLGGALEKLERPAEAADAYRRAVEREPQSDIFRHNLILALRQAGTGFEERERLLRARLANHPGDVESLNYLTNVLTSLGKFAEARKTIARMQALDLNTSEAAHARLLGAELDFLEGDWERGWSEYAARRGKTQHQDRYQDLPEWQGGPLDGMRLLVWKEQGVGDEIMFSRFLPLLVDTGARVRLETDARLVPLFARSFPDIEVVALDDPGAADGVDLQVAIGGLGRRLWPTFRDAGAANVGAPLRADPERARARRAAYTRGAAAKVVGVSWHSANAAGGPDKSMPVTGLAPVLARPDTVFVDLQYGDTEAARAEAEAQLGVKILHDDSFDQMDDLDGFAAQIAALDAVVSISNTAVHMAGGLGVPTAVLLPPVPMWRWGLAGADTVWYPSVRLFRQARLGAWAAPVGEAAAWLDGILA
ncbi:MAG: tetratricopeptide repeat protein [Magnetovibrio sp.]|nr:tetratricopeptide repeat protein [Magnetovibrio sp.]